MNLTIDVYSDGADLKDILEQNKNPMIKGFTTNPTLMRQAGITDYKGFAQELLGQIKDKPISFEVFADEFEEMHKQALELNSWGENVYVKIPVMNTKKQYAYELIKELSKAGCKLNVTAIMTLDQVRHVNENLVTDKHSIISVFAGRIADTGVDPLPMMRSSVELVKDRKNVDILWASPREILNLYQAQEVGCGIITITPSLLSKTKLFNKDLEEFSLETVKMFYDDAQASQFAL